MEFKIIAPFNLIIFGQWNHYIHRTVPGPFFTAKDGERKIALGTRLCLNISPRYFFLLDLARDAQYPKPANLQRTKPETLFLSRNDQIYIFALDTM